MACDSLTEGCPSFNQLSPFSGPKAAIFHSSEHVSKVEFAISLLAQAEALSSVALHDALAQLSASERHHYLTTLHELIVAANEQLDDALTASSPPQPEE